MHLPLLFYTLIGSLSDDPEFTRSDIGCFILLIRCPMRPDMLRGVGVFLYLFWYILIFLFIHISVNSLLPCISDSSLFHFYIHYHHAWTFICVIAVTLFLFIRFFV